LIYTFGLYWRFCEKYGYPAKNILKYFDKKLRICLIYREISVIGKSEKDQKIAKGGGDSRYCIDLIDY